MDAPFYETRWFIYNILDQRRKYSIYLCDEGSTIFKHILDCSATFEIVRSPGGESRFGRRHIIDIYLGIDGYGKKPPFRTSKVLRLNVLTTFVTSPFYQC
jgi:hypothetical protein